MPDQYVANILKTVNFRKSETNKDNTIIIRVAVKTDDGLKHFI